MIYMANHVLRALTFLGFLRVGAPPEIVSLLDEIWRENGLSSRHAVSSCLGADPELDEFMETYCDMLVKYKSDLARPLDEATTFLNKIEMQLTNLCIGASNGSLPDEAAVSSEEDFSGGEVEIQDSKQRVEDQDLKNRLLRRFGSHIGSLKLEFSKKKKKGKLPREARQTLLQWWNVHYKWPYPTVKHIFKIHICKPCNFMQLTFISKLA
ncbi:hypothetical protein I3843_06G064500 [Carya illinoinensis]|nr:hypothetical protein I3760_06G069300 [Carya illinoinensis]KAG7974760.1 hypothetical protein I3843_06G064500 [Carya illinoinensis]